jgi:nucleotide-binding universal stress UspA family protein
MFPFRKIMLPIDYSAPCEAVVPYVTEMLRRFSADLTLVHAFGAEALAYSELSITDPDLAADARAKEGRILQEFALEAFPGHQVECFVEVGEPGSIIHKIIHREGTDLVMLPTHGRGPIRRFLLGSVAAKVLHDVSAPVWTGTRYALMHDVPSIPYKSVVCALDDSDEAEGVLKAAAAFACAYNAQLWLVHVVETPPATVDIDFSPYMKDLMAAADLRLRELKCKLGINAAHAVIDGSIADRVRDEVSRRKADLIITGRGHSQTAISSMWSQVYPIVRESPCPVLSI